MITPEELVNRGFEYYPCGTCGADMWQGMAFWYNKKKGINLRGNISTASGGTLHLSGHFNCQMNTLEELDSLIKLFR